MICTLAFALSLVVPSITYNEPVVCKDAAAVDTNVRMLCGENYRVWTRSESKFGLLLVRPGMDAAYGWGAVTEVRNNLGHRKHSYYPWLTEFESMSIYSPDTYQPPVSYGAYGRLYSNDWVNTSSNKIVYTRITAWSGTVMDVEKADVWNWKLKYENGLPIIEHIKGGKKKQYYLKINGNHKILRLILRPRPVTPGSVNEVFETSIDE